MRLVRVHKQWVDGEPPLVIILMQMVMAAVRLPSVRMPMPFQLRVLMGLIILRLPLVRKRLLCTLVLP